MEVRILPGVLGDDYFKMSWDYVEIVPPDDEFGKKLTRANGMVLEHRYVASKLLGRLIKTNEVVHHKDEDPTNNSPENIEIMTLEEHSRLHRSGTTKPLPKKQCKYCKVYFKSNRPDSKYCSTDCAHRASRKFEVSKDKLEKLVWTYPSTKVAKMFNVTDKAIEKRCRKLGIEKPPRGYWAKKRAGH